MSVRVLASALCLGAAIATAAFAAEPFSEPSQLDLPQAGYYRLKVGKVDVIAVNDGAAPFDVLGVVSKDKKAAAARIMADVLVTSPVQASVNAFVILRGDKTILVDAGTGDLFGIKLGKLPNSLRAVGIQPETVTDILVTHIHPDHTGGLVSGDTRVFPNATVRVNRRELAFWTDASAGARAFGPTKQFFGQVPGTIGAYVRSGQVKTFEGATDVVPGIRAVPAYGHTPGHTYYALEDRGRTLVFMGDTIHAPDAQFTDPSITVEFDIDQKAAAASRQKAFADAAKGGYWVAFAHMYFPGIGRIKKEREGYRWLPLPYVNDAPRP